MASGNRVGDIDVLRGLALSMIFINHMPGHFGATLTSRAFGFSDAAELFVFCFGFSACLAYRAVLLRAGPLALLVKLTGRAFRLYTSHILLFVAVAALVNYLALRLGNPSYFDVVNVAGFFSQTNEALPAALTLAYQPMLLDILPLYIALSPFVLLFLAAGRAHWTLVPLAAATIYAAADLSVARDTLPSWYFHPLYWQAVFALGFAAASMPPAQRQRLVRCRWLLGAALVFLVFSLLVMAPWRRIPLLTDLVVIPAELLGSIEKARISPWRLAHVAALMLALAALARRWPRLLRCQAALALALLGRNSLPVFCSSVLLSTGGYILLIETGYPLALQVAIALAGSAVLFAVAWFCEQHRRPLPQGPRLQAQPS